MANVCLFGFFIQLEIFHLPQQHMLSAVTNDHMTSNNKTVSPPPSLPPTQIKKFLNWQHCQIFDILGPVHRFIRHSFHEPNLFQVICNVTAGAWGKKFNAVSHKPTRAPIQFNSRCSRQLWFMGYGIKISFPRPPQ